MPDHMSIGESIVIGFAVVYVSWLLLYQFATGALRNMEDGDE